MRTQYLKPLSLLLLVVVSYIGAISRGDSLLWVVAAFLLATLIVGVTWPHWLVRGLSVVRSGPERANEGDSVRFRVEVENPGRFPRFMVEVIDHLPFIEAASGKEVPTVHALGLVAYVGGGERRTFDVALDCKKRGFYRLGPVNLASSFPLGLAEVVQYRNRGIQSLTIYPQAFPVLSLPLHGTPSQIHKGAFLLPEATGVAEFSGLREYRRGDNPRYIHWATTARMNELMVREFEPLASASLCLALDLSSEANVGKGRHATLEYAVKIAASVAQYASTSGMPFRLAGAGDQTLASLPGTGDNHYQNLLEVLAVIDADGTTPYAVFLENLAKGCEYGETVMVFMSEPVSRVDRTLQAIATLRTAGVHVLAVVFDRISFEGNNARSGSQAATSTLLDLGAAVIEIHCGDDLVKVFNP